MADEEKKPLNLKLILGGVILLLALVGLSSFATSYMVSKTMAQPKEPAVAGQEVKRSGPMVDLGEYTTNLSGNEGANYIKVKITFEVSNEEAVKELETKAPMVKHLINSVLRGKSKEELNEKDGMDKLAQLLKKAVNQKMVEGRILETYFPSFVIS